jgi:homospermidine synthase
MPVPTIAAATTTEKAMEPAEKRRRRETGTTDLPPAPTDKFVKFEGKTFLIMGFGSIGQGSLPLVLRHIDLRPDQVVVLTGEDRKEEAEAAAKKYGIKAVTGMLLKDSYEKTLEQFNLGPKDFMFNVTVDVSSTDMMTYCNKRGALYIDTVVEPWLGAYTDASVSPAMRSNYMMREGMLELKQKFGPSAVTALTTHGANPGMVSHFVKQALVNIAIDNGLGDVVPKTRREWGELAQRLDIKTIHIAERDTQVREKPKEVGEFVNTWSIDGFISEGCQPSEVGWGTHEKQLPPDGHHHETGTKAAIWLNQPGVRTRVRTWTPMEGCFHGFCVTHNESISIADYFTLRGDGGEATYRPTVHYAYHPCDDAVLSLHELAGKNYVEQKKEIVDAR